MILALPYILTTLVVLLSGYVLFCYLRKLRLYKEVAKLPGPPTLPLIGNAHCFIGNTEDILKSIMDQMDTYSSPYRIWLGNRLFYVIYDPEQLKTALHSPTTINRLDLYDFAKPWVGTGTLLSARDDGWRTRRKLIQPTFNPRILESFVEVFSAKSEIMMKEMEIEVDGKEFDIFRYVSLCVLDITCETSMGVASYEQAQKTSTYLNSAKKILEIIQTRMLKIWLHPDIIFYNTKHGRDMLECMKYMHEFTNNVVGRKKEALKYKETHQSDNFSRLSTSGERNAFLDQLIGKSDEGIKLTNEELRQEVDAMMVAANESTATVYSFTMLMLASYPEIQDKLFKELCEIYGSDDPCARPVKNEDLRRMKYLDNVVKETLRLFPVLPLLFRQIADDLNIGKFTLAKGSSLILGIIKTHRDGEHWRDPLTFDTDRFSPDESAKRHSYAYTPFSAGPRNCIGLNYAMMAMKVMIATTVRKYVIKKDNILPIRDIKLKLHVTVKPVEPIMIRIEKRLHRKDGPNDNQ